MVEHYTVREMALKMNVSLKHVYDLVRGGRLPGAFKIDGQWQIPASAVEARLARRREQGERNVEQPR
jgi:excisionase family DNA binding protein